MVDPESCALPAVPREFGFCGVARPPAINPALVEEADEAFLGVEAFARFIDAPNARVEVSHDERLTVEELVARRVKRLIEGLLLILLGEVDPGQFDPLNFDRYQAMGI